MIFQTLALTNKNFFAILKKGWWVLFIGALVLEIPVQYLHQYQRSVEGSMMELGPGAVDSLRLINQMMILMVEGLITAFILFCGAVYSHAVYKNNADAQLLEITKSTAVPLTVESLRALGKTILGLVLFIIPGLYFYVRYSQVPFVVMFSNAYKSGKADALKMSNYLVAGNTLKVTVFLIVTGACSLYLSVLKDSHPPSETPLLFGICFFLSFLVQVYFCVASYFLFDRIFESKKNTLPEEN